MRTKASAIVPAYNEQDTILNVIRRLENHPLIDEVIVVSDGSTDETVKRARSSTATVIELRENVGKGEAMTIAVTRAKNDVIAFFDADLVGLTDLMITKLIDEVRSGRHDMFTLVRDRKSETFQLHISPYLVIGGERALTMKLWNTVPREELTGYSVEMALNYYAHKNNMKVGIALAEGLKQVPKEVKRGLLLGFMHRIGETAEWMAAMVRLYIFGIERGRAA
jgi:glycosyltransferase involved in cell wall biosynthesis